MSKPLISVVIPAYNRRNTLPKCIESVLNQTYNNIEIIVVDDCSQDGTKELFENNTDPRLRYFRLPENRGACYARNYGVRQSFGKYIAFQDSDDLWRADKLEKEFEYLDSNHLDFVFCGMIRHEADGSRFFYPNRSAMISNNMKDQLLYENIVSTQTMLMKVSIFEKAQFSINLKRFQDWDFALQVTNCGFKIGYLDEALVDSFVQNNSISANKIKSENYLDILNRYKNQYMYNSTAYANMLMLIARTYRNTDYKNTVRFLYKSLRYQFKLKTLVKLFMAFLGMWR